MTIGKDDNNDDGDENDDDYDANINNKHVYHSNS